MDKTQAEVSADALMEPQLQAQEAVRLERERDARGQMRQRRIASLILVGAAVGAAIGHFTSVGIAQGVLYGALSACLVAAVLWRSGSA